MASLACLALKPSHRRTLAPLLVRLDIRHRHRAFSVAAASSSVPAFPAFPSGPSDPPTTRTLIVQQRLPNKKHKWVALKTVLATAAPLPPAPASPSAPSPLSHASSSHPPPALPPASDEWVSKATPMTFSGPSYRERWNEKHVAVPLAHPSSRPSVPAASSPLPPAAGLASTGPIALASDLVRKAWQVEEEAKHRLTVAFLPKGYPHSVTPNYMAYTRWQAVQSIAGTMCGVFSTQALLYAIGLGAGSIPLAAALNWIIKDGLGQLGGVIYSTVISSKFDSDPKRHRFWSNVALQASTLLEVLTPLVPQFFLLLASISNIGKNISWLAASSTRAQMHNSMTLKDNLGDITGKAGSQGIATSLIGTGLGIAIAPFVGSDPIHVLIAFMPLAAINIFANYLSTTIVHMRTLNVQRAERLLFDFLARNQGALANGASVQGLDYAILRPSQVSRLETFIFRYQSIFGTRLYVEPALPHVFQHPAPAAATAATRGDSRLGWLAAQWRRWKAQSRATPSSVDSFGLSLLLNDKWLAKPGQMFFLAVVNATLEPRPFVPPLLSDGHLFSPHTVFSLFPESRAGVGAGQDQRQSSRAVCLWFRDGATSLDMVGGFLHACVLRFAMEHPDVRSSLLPPPPLLSQREGLCDSVSSVERSAIQAKFESEFGAGSSKAGGTMAAEFELLMDELRLSRACHTLALSVTPLLLPALQHSGWRTKTVFLAESDARLSLLSEEQLRAEGASERAL